MQGRLKEDKITYTFFSDVKNAHVTVSCDGLWLTLWEMGVSGRIIKQMYEFSRSMVPLEGEKSETFSLKQDVAQGCSLSPILFSGLIYDLSIEVEEVGLGVQLNNGKSIASLPFADDFMGISDSSENLQKLIDAVL